MLLTSPFISANQKQNGGFLNRSALGRRVRQRTTGSGVVDTVYVLAGQQVIAEDVYGTAPASPTEKYVYASYIDEPILKDGTLASGTGIVYYHRDRRYSVSCLSDTTGTAVERYAYSPYGALTILDGAGVSRTSTAYNNAYTYTGRSWDSATGLYYFRARYFEPAIGIFLTRDPLEYVDGMSVYRGYFGVRGADPIGEKLIKTTTIGSKKGSCDDHETLLWQRFSIDDADRFIRYIPAGRSRPDEIVPARHRCYWIQIVSFHCRRNQCQKESGCKLGKEKVLTYMEAGKINVDVVSESGYFDHEFKTGSRKNECGHFHWTARLRVYCNNKEAISAIAAMDKRKTTHEFEDIDGSLCYNNIHAGPYYTKLRDESAAPSFWHNSKGEYGEVFYGMSLDFQCCDFPGNFHKPIFEVPITKK